MHLNVAWTNPTPQAGCGYQVLYRKELYPEGYTTFLTSGSTSGSTSLSIVVAIPANYEGNVYSNCCDGLSTPVPFGVNGFSTIYVGISLQLSPSKYLATISSPFPNPYDTLLSGTFISSVAGLVSFSATYPANSTSSVIVLSNTPVSANETFSNITITALVSNFNNGGQLQQWDNIGTPSYFGFYSTSGTTSGITMWNGSPTALPSFVLRQFNVTSTNISGDTLTGDLLINWIQNYLYNAGLSPYDFVTYKVYDPGNNLLGSVSTTGLSNGLRTATISLTRSSGTYPLIISTQFRMDVVNSAGSVINTKVFYLPL